MRRALAPALAVAASLASACAPVMKLPAGPGAPAVDGQQALGQAIAVCRTISTISFQAAVAGSIDGRRIPRARLLVGLAAPSSARIEAPAPFGAPLFVFAARDGDATLLLERDRRVLEHGRPDAVLDALAGIPLDAPALRLTLTGCLEPFDQLEARQLGDDWRMIPQAADVAYLHRGSRNAPWQLVALVHGAANGAGEPNGTRYRAEYRDFLNGLPRTIRLTSVDSNRFDLRLTLSQVDINVPLDAEAFRVQIPPSTQPIELEELRRSGPLGAVRSDGR